MLRHVRGFFQNREFVEVTTPLLTRRAGGALARPFDTTATEFSNVNLQLRIAPELFLKRLICGGMEKIFEIGPAFRNEGIDARHNPEFYICEFYQIMTDLNDLILMTEELLSSLMAMTKSARSTMTSLPDPATLGLSTPFKRVEFIPALEQAIRPHLDGFTFPNLSNEEEARASLATALGVCGRQSEDSSSVFSIPGMLDELSSLLLEVQSNEGALWITHHPACMSPLAKSFNVEYAALHGQSHPVSARAELFIKGVEYVNCYEEENSPIEQRRKFLEQRGYQLQDRGKSINEANEDELAIDENYVQALEWGMPPTGGWGCGVDRLVGLFSGRKRIADVLSFGTLANVVALGSQGPAAGRRKKIEDS
ncbi:MAG: hypothetical protein Q9159_003482 [Coniocarpon cinnabarinum]